MGNYTRIRGRTFERQLELLHSYYLDARIARVKYQGLTASYRGKRVIATKSAPDFGGVLRGGRLVAFDAKVIKPKADGRLIYAHDKRRAHQCQELYALAYWGAVAFILISVDFEQYYLLWPQVSWNLVGGWSVNLKEMAMGVGVPVGIYEGRPSERLPDWMAICGKLAE